MERKHPNQTFVDTLRAVIAMQGEIEELRKENAELTEKLNELKKEELRA